MSGGKKMVIAGGVAAIGAGVASAYYLLGPNAKSHQKKASVLMAKIKREVKSEIKKAKEISVPLYNKAIDVVSQNYAKQYKMHEKEIKAFAERLKGEWKEIRPLTKSSPRAKKSKKAR